MKRRKSSQHAKDPTADFHAGRLDDDSSGQRQQFNRRSKFNQQMKTERTAVRRLESQAADIDLLPIGRVIQVFSLFSEVRHELLTRLCVVRKTLHKVSDTSVVVGDMVRFRLSPQLNDAGQPDAVIEQIEPRNTVLTRADSFKAQQNHPIVANAEQMLIVAAVVMPEVKWGLIDRMLIAARSGGLVPILVLNKVDLAPPAELADAREKLSHYRSLGIACIETSVTQGTGLDTLRAALHEKTTVLAGHSGVGKSSLARAVDSTLDLKVGEISVVHQKGKHTTTSARIYPLVAGGEVIDTPGVKLFGLWNTTAQTIDDHFPDITAGTAPAWRVESRDRIVQSLRRETGKPSRDGTR